MKNKKIIFIISMMLILFACIPSLAASSKLSQVKNINVNDINLNSIEKSKINDVKKVINEIDINSLSTSSAIKNVSKEDIKSKNINAINTDSIDMDEVADVYSKLSDVISNEEIADLISDNKELLSDVGVSNEVLSTSETMLRTFDSDAVIEVMQNDELDINKLINMYKNGSSLDEIISAVMKETSTQTKINLLVKLLFSISYIRIAIFVLILVAIYSIFITSRIFKKAGKNGFGAIIPIYRDVVHLEVCGLSPWLLLLIFIPVLGWLMLIAIAIIGRFELAKKFGHGFFFGLGLLLFPTIFRSVIAFSDNEYIEDLYEEAEE